MSIAEELLYKGTIQKRGAKLEYFNSSEWREEILDNIELETG